MSTTVYEQRTTGAVGINTGAVGADTGSAVESPVAAVSWPAIFAGAFVAAAVSIMLVALGSGLGIAAVMPWPTREPSATAFAVSTGIWLIVVQWLASALGGYVAGRLRTKWVGVHTHEVFFRDTAHGFVTWAVATVFVAAIAAAGASVVGAHAASGSALAALTPESGQAAEVARKAAAAASIFTALSMVVGAFIASVAAALGGSQRDEHP
ncbi:MAG TPA: hypothetical protein VGM84_15945 [Steroidobacteraceae bacterium]|jgi:hypothetical protein